MRGWEGIRVKTGVQMCKILEKLKIKGRNEEIVER